MAWPLRRHLTASHSWMYDRRETCARAMLVLISIYMAAEAEANWLEWVNVNWMVVTGLLVGLLFFWTTNDTRERFEKIADALSEDASVRFASAGSGPGNRKFVERERQKALHRQAKERIEGEAAVWGYGISAIFVPTSVFVLYLVSNGDPTPIKVLLYLVVIPMAFACGLRIGRMACYGWQGWSYKTKPVDGCQIVIVPKLGHPDGRAGLAAIGQFYNHQVGRMAWLIGFLLIWLFVLSKFEAAPFVKNQYPDHVGAALFVLFCIIFAQQILGFFLPMWSISRELGHWKRRETEKNFEEVKRIEADESGSPDAGDTALALRRIHLRHQREDIAAMSLWPVSVDTLRQFWAGKFASVLIAAVAGYNDIKDFAIGVL